MQSFLRFKNKKSNIVNNSVIIDKYINFNINFPNYLHNFYVIQN